MNFKYSPLHSRASSSASAMEDGLDVYPRKPTNFRRPRLVNVAILLGLASLLSLGVWTMHPFGEMSPTSEAVADDLLESPPSVVEENTTSWNTRVLRGGPAAHFRDALRPDVKYITSWPAAGWTNDVMTMVNMIYLGVITERVPIVPPFTPSHVLQDGVASEIPFGDVFDVPRMQKLMNTPILEWRDVKSQATGESDELGCWNVWEATQYHEPYPRRSSVPGLLKLDISYTLAPSWIKLYPNYEHDSHATFWSLARLAYPETREASLVTPLPSPNNVSLPPDEQLLCYDYLYYVCAQQPYEYDWEYSPAWRFVAQHMHFTPALEHLANIYINRAIGIPEDEPTPPYIGIHVRHSDFGDCFAPLSAIARRVQEVKDEVMEKSGRIVDHVVVTSDEKDPAWWQDVANLGWVAPDHSQTIQLFGPWYPVLIDAVIQSGVRTGAWQNGATRYVEWGRPGADDH
ncbi:hypothetical protein CPB85DRAFT_1265699 [Mucidula mucida]|nr:hypothetical protein CPB85DRAFT_1265699 [Mucidula mucida]